MGLKKNAKWTIVLKSPWMFAECLHNTSPNASTPEPKNMNTLPDTMPERMQCFSHLVQVFWLEDNTALHAWYASLLHSLIPSSPVCLTSESGSSLYSSYYVCWWSLSCITRCLLLSSRYGQTLQCFLIVISMPDCDMAIFYAERVEYYNCELVHLQRAIFCCTLFFNITPYLT